MSCANRMSEIKFYAKIYQYGVIFMSVRLNIAENMFLTICKRLYTIVDIYSDFVTPFLRGGVVAACNHHY